MSVDVVLHGELVRTQEQLKQLLQDVAAARQDIEQVTLVAEKKGVKRVLRGITAAPNYGIDVEIPEVVMEKSVLSLLSYFASPENLSFAGISFTSPTSLRLNSATGSSPLHWQLVEYY